MEWRRRWRAKVGEEGDEQDIEHGDMKGRDM